MGQRVVVEELTPRSFSPFGAFIDLVVPNTESIGERPVTFFRDMAQLNLGGTTQASFSICQVEERPAVVDKTEFHSHCGEAILPLDGDVLIHVAPATPGNKVPVEKIKIFRVRRGTLVILKPGVWHHAPFFLKGEDENFLEINVLIVLPERTYTNDCQVVDLDKSQQVEIVLKTDA